ncbi:MAG: hypothetical protein FJX11_16495 [Alphaproteobacteria bacterium]|nr:hypothetical protein [Alphaproteobacteria bacterium]
MARAFDLPRELASARWKVKVRDKERTEPPHVSVLRGTQCWRWGLRERAFLDSEPSPADLPKNLVQHLENIHDEMCAAWNDMYPHNPVTSKDDEDE